MQFELVPPYEASSSVEADSLCIFDRHYDVCGVLLASDHPLEEGGDQLLTNASASVGRVDGDRQELDAPARPHPVAGTVPERLECLAPSSE